MCQCSGVASFGGSQTSRKKPQEAKTAATQKPCDAMPVRPEMHRARPGLRLQQLGSFFASGSYVRDSMFWVHIRSLLGALLWGSSKDSTVLGPY